MDNRRYAERPRALTALRAAGLLALATVIVLPASASAQVAGGDGFLFRQPNFTFAVRGGYAVARAGSDIFDFVTEELTLDRSDFHSPAFGADLGIRLTDRLDLVVGGGFARASERSEFVEFEGTDGLPIEQRTTLIRVPLTASLRYYLMPRGRSIGQFAWIPSGIAPYLGAGGGTMRYSFVQDGEFVDYDDLSIWRDELASRGWTGTGHLFGGVELGVTRRSGFTAEARYSWAGGNLGFDFEGFDDPIDLSGLQLMIGWSVRF